MLEDLIVLLGSNFRGLWRSYYCNFEDEILTDKWTVTFIYKGQYIETPNCDTRQEALEFAIGKLKK